GHRLEHPRLAAPVLEALEPLERGFTLRRIGRQRRHHEREPRLAIGILRARVLRFEDRAPAGHLPYRQLERERDLVGLRQREAGNPFFTAPDALEPCDAGGRLHGVAIGVEPRRLLALRPRALESLPQGRLERGPSRGAIGRRQPLPERTRHIGEDALRVLLVTL